jgi:hypothetical protein
MLYVVSRIRLHLFASRRAHSAFRRSGSFLLLAWRAGRAFYIKDAAFTAGMCAARPERLGTPFTHNSSRSRAGLAPGDAFRD